MKTESIFHIHLINDENKMLHYEWPINNFLKTN